tara:strand:- start:2533 stop:2949 length:417 start_codon:yes stop_codon:yes gene_type:complete
MLTKTKLENYTYSLNIPLNIEKYKRALFNLINKDNTKKLQVCFTKADGSDRYLIGDIKNRIKYLNKDKGTFVYSKRDSMLGLRKNLKQNNILQVFDQEKNAYRCIKIEKIKYIRKHKTRYQIKEYTDFGETFYIITKL